MTVIGGKNISKNISFFHFFFLGFIFRAVVCRKDQKKVFLLISEEVSRGALTGNNVRDCGGRGLFQTNICVLVDRFC